MYFLAEIGQVIKEIGIPPFYKYGHDIPVVLYGFGDKAFLPYRVLYHSVCLAADHACWKHNHLAIGGIGVFNGGYGIFGERAVFVYRQKYVVQVF